MNMKIDGVVGLLGITIGLVGVGYALGTRSKMAKISEKLDYSIDQLANDVPIDIPSSMVERAVDKAVAYEVKQVAGKATDAVVLDIKRDVHKQVSDAVEKEYSDIKGTVLATLAEEASKIDVTRVRADVERAAKDAALKKFDVNLDGILAGFNDQLRSTHKIYNSIAESMNRYGANNPGMLFR